MYMLNALERVILAKKKRKRRKAFSNSVVLVASSPPLNSQFHFFSGYLLFYHQLLSHSIFPSCILCSTKKNTEENMANQLAQKMNGLGTHARTSTCVLLAQICNVSHGCYFSLELKQIYSFRETQERKLHLRAMSAPMRTENWIK